MNLQEGASKLYQYKNKDDYHKRLPQTDSYPFGVDPNQRRSSRRFSLDSQMMPTDSHADLRSHDENVNDDHRRIQPPQNGNTMQHESLDIQRLRFSAQIDHEGSGLFNPTQHDLHHANESDPVWAMLSNKKRGRENSRQKRSRNRYEFEHHHNIQVPQSTIGQLHRNEWSMSSHPRANGWRGEACNQYQQWSCFPETADWDQENDIPYQSGYLETNYHYPFREAGHQFPQHNDSEYSGAVPSYPASDTPYLDYYFHPNFQAETNTYSVLQSGDYPGTYEKSTISTVREDVPQRNYHHAQPTINNRDHIPTYNYDHHNSWTSFDRNRDNSLQFDQFVNDHVEWKQESFPIDRVLDTNQHDMNDRFTLDQDQSTFSHPNGLPHWLRQQNNTEIEHPCGFKGGEDNNFYKHIQHSSTFTPHTTIRRRPSSDHIPGFPHIKTTPTGVYPTPSPQSFKPMVTPVAARRLSEHDLCQSHSRTRGDIHNYGNLRMQLDPLHDQSQVSRARQNQTAFQSQPSHSMCDGSSQHVLNAQQYGDYTDEKNRRNPLYVSPCDSLSNPYISTDESSESPDLSQHPYQRMTQTVVQTQHSTVDGTHMKNPQHLGSGEVEKPSKLLSCSSDDRHELTNGKKRTFRLEDIDLCVNGQGTVIADPLSESNNIVFTMSSKKARGRQKAVDSSDQEVVCLNPDGQSNRLLNNDQRFLETISSKNIILPIKARYNRGQIPTCYIEVLDDSPPEARDVGPAMYDCIQLVQPMLEYLPHRDVTNESNSNDPCVLDDEMGEQLSQKENNGSILEASQLNTQLDSCLESDCISDMGPPQEDLTGEDNDYYLLCSSDKENHEDEMALSFEDAHTRHLYAKNDNGEHSLVDKQLKADIELYRKGTKNLLNISNTLSPSLRYSEP